MVLQQGTIKGTYQGERWHCPRLCSSSHHPENCLEKGCPSIAKPEKHPCPVLDHGHTHAQFWITGTPMPGSGSQTYPCLVLDHGCIHARFWITSWSTWAL